MLSLKFCRTFFLTTLFLAACHDASSQQSSNSQSLIDKAKNLEETGSSAEIGQLLPNLHTAANAATNIDQQMLLLMEAGLLERKVQHYQDALTDFQAAAALVQQANPGAYGVLTGDIAAVYYDLGDSQHALSILDGVLATTTDWNLKLIFNSTKGFILGQQGHNNEAIDALNAAIAAVPAGEVNYRETEIQRTLCEQYEALSQYDAASQHCQLALQSTHGAINSGYVSTQISDAEVRDARGDAAGFKTELQSALANAKQLNDETLILRAQVDLTTVAARNGDDANALKSLDAALSSPVLAVDARATALTNKSLVLGHLGRLDEAKKAATEAAAEFRTLGQPSVASTINLSGVLVQTHFPSEAIALLEQLKPSMGSNPNTHEWVTVHDNLGAAYGEAFQPAKAYNEFSLERTAATALGDPRQIAAAEYGLGDASLMLRHPEEAHRHAENALAQLQQSPDGFLEIKARELLAVTLSSDLAGELKSLVLLQDEAERAHMQAVSTEALLILARLSRQSNSQGDGLKYATKAFTNAKSMGDEELQALSLNVTASIYSDQGKFSDAEPLFDQSIAHVEKWRAGAGADVFRTSLDNLLLLPFQDALLEAYKAQHFQRAFEIEEEMKAKLLVERLHGSVKTGARADGGLLDQELALRSQLDGLEAARTALWNAPTTDDTTKEIRDVTGKLTARRKDYDQLIQQISLQQPLRAIALDTGRPTLSNLQQSIPIDGTVVEYAFVEDHLMIFVVSHATFDCRVVTLTQTDLKSQLQNLKSLGFADLQHRPSVLADMYAELIAPVRSLIHTKQIIVVPDGVVRDVPFAALYDGSRYLSESFSVANIATAKVLRVSPQAIAPATAKYLLASYANPDGLQLLTQADGEVNDIASIFGTVATTNETRKNFLTSAVTATIIHVAAHAEPDPAQPTLSKLYLRPDNGQQDSGTLTVFDIAGMTLSKTRLAVLSACNSNVSAVNELDEAVGFPESFMEAGVSTTISSLWLVNDSNSRELMKYFYTSLRSGERVDQALAEAQAKIRINNPHPYFWAGFVVVGDGGKVF